MSYTEYYDLYDKCQDTAPCHLFVFDIAGSSKLSKADDTYISKISFLINKVYEKIETIERVQNRQILYRSPYIYRPKLKEYQKGYFCLEGPILPPDKKIFQRVELCDPFQIMGDTIGLTILRDTLTVAEVYSIFDQTKDELNIPYAFHYANGFYETDLYVEGGTKLYRGYAIMMLTNQHKRKKKVKRKIKEN